MINFRYHIVSLMAVFLALSVGIVVGVSLRPSIDEGLAQQATQDRKTVQDLRAEMDRLNGLADYRDAYAEQVDPLVTAGVLGTYRVAVVVMPGAPKPVVDSIATAVGEAGGQLAAVATVNQDVFDGSLTDRVNQALSVFAAELGLADDMSPATRVGLALGRALATTTSGTADPAAVAVGRALAQARLVSIDRTTEDLAQLVIVVTAPAVLPGADEPDSAAHVQLELALAGRAGGLVVAGPNSEGLTGTDVAGIRSTAAAADVMSTVDVADLASGVSTVVVAGKEQLLGRHGHYGALAGADSAAPDLPVR